MKAVFLLLILASCGPRPATRTDDDYVLIEFAAKLEEDYERNGGSTVARPPE